MGGGRWGEYRGKYDRNGVGWGGVLALFIAAVLVFLAAILLWQ